MRIISVLALSLVMAAQAFMPSNGPSMGRSRGVMNMLKVRWSDKLRVKAVV